jgi:hypothetical protein
MNKSHLIVKGARVNNLKNISVKIPRDKIVVVTGLSGSGNHRWLLTQFSPRDIAGMSKIFRLMPGNFWPRRAVRKSTRSKIFRPSSRLTSIR